MYEAMYKDVKVTEHPQQASGACLQTTFACIDGRIGRQQLCPQTFRLHAGHGMDSVLHWVSKAMTKKMAYLGRARGAVPGKQTMALLKTVGKDRATLMPCIHNKD